MENNLNRYDLYHIYNTETPLMVLLGPPMSGKTMLMKRLVDYLFHTQNCCVKPRMDFAHTCNDGYRILCNHFDEIMSSVKWLPGNGYNGMILADVLDAKYGHSKFQILDIPGELCLSEENDPLGLPLFLMNIPRFGNYTMPKTWCIFLDVPKQASSYNQYMKTLRQLNMLINRKKDKVLFILPKADNLCGEMVNGNITKSKIRQLLSHDYGELIEMYRNTNLLTCLFRPYNCDFLAFSAGSAFPGQEIYTVSPDKYPETLYKKIIKS